MRDGDGGRRAGDDRADRIRSLEIKCGVRRGSWTKAQGFKAWFWTLLDTVQKMLAGSVMACSLFTMSRDSSWADFFVKERRRVRKSFGSRTSSATVTG